MGSLHWWEFPLFFTGHWQSLCTASTHWGRVMHICISNLTTIGSVNGLSPGRRQAITWTNVGILLTGSLGTNFSEILIGIQTFSFKKMHLKMSSAKFGPSCLGLMPAVKAVQRGLWKSLTVLRLPKPSMTARSASIVHSSSGWHQTNYQKFHEETIPWECFLYYWLLWGKQMVTGYAHWCFLCWWTNSLVAIDLTHWGLMMALDDINLMAPSHYLNQCWLLINEVLRHSTESNFTAHPQCMKWPVAHSPNLTWFGLELVGNCCERLKIIMKFTNVQFCERLGHGWQFHPLHP